MGCYWVWSLLLETNIATGFINTPLKKKKKGQAIPEKYFPIVQVLNKTPNNKPTNQT